MWYKGSDSGSEGAEASGALETGSVKVGASTGIEIWFVAAAVAIAFAYPQLASNWFCRAEQALGGLARRQTTSVLLGGVLAVVVRAVVLPGVPVAEPFPLDECL